MRSSSGTWSARSPLRDRRPDPEQQPEPARGGDAGRRPRSPLAEKLVDSSPNSCLAVRLGRTHAQSTDDEPLLTCDLCSQHSAHDVCPVARRRRGDRLGARRPRAAAERLRAGPDRPVGQPGRARARQPPQPRGRRGPRRHRRAHRPAERAQPPREPRPHGRAGGPVESPALRSALRPRPLQADQRRLRAREGRPGAGRRERRAQLVAPRERSRRPLRRRGVPDPAPGHAARGRRSCWRRSSATRSSLVNVPGVDRAITASFGVASFPDDTPDGDMLVRMADRALYAAKALGRNCVVTSAELLAAVRAS